jgi:phosphoribosylanthranilate isomerase
MFQIKICGITNEEDAKMVVEAGADALGLNFYPKSPRFITHETAARILPVIPGGVLKVGLFVNEAVEMVTNAFDNLGLDLIQLHGDEPPEYLVQLGHRPVMKVFRLSEEDLRPIDMYLESCKQFPVTNLSYLLLDSHVKGVYGGSGVTADWAVCAEFSQRRNHPPLVLAGGLTSGNVAQAIHVVRPVAVDTANGVEVHPGKKDPKLLAAFVENARAAFLSKDR